MAAVEGKDDDLFSGVGRSVYGAAVQGGIGKGEEVTAEREGHRYTRKKTDDRSHTIVLIFPNDVNSKRAIDHLSVKAHGPIIGLRSTRNLPQDRLRRVWCGVRH